MQKKDLSDAHLIVVGVSFFLDFLAYFGAEVAQAFGLVGAARKFADGAVLVAVVRTEGAL